MKNPENSKSRASFPRRTLLKGAVGASLAGLGSSTVLGKVLDVTRAAPGSTPTLFYWNGGRLVEANTVSSEPTIEQVRITISGFGAGEMKAVEALSLVPDRGGVRRVPFRAWSASGGEGRQTRFLMTVDPAVGVVLSVVTATGKSELRLALRGSSPRLREGVYFLSLSSLKGFRYEPGASEAPLVGGVEPPQYVMLRVERV